MTRDKTETQMFTGMWLGMLALAIILVGGNTASRIVYAVDVVSCIEYRDRIAVLNAEIVKIKRSYGEIP